jgi:hypothetical protein
MSASDGKPLLSEGGGLGRDEEGILFCVRRGEEGVAPKASELRIESTKFDILESVAVCKTKGSVWVRG